MDVRAAAALIHRAVRRDKESWADLGAGSGTFTLALASLLAPGSRVTAIDRDAAALESLRTAALRAALGDRIATLVGDFRDPLDLPPLHGILLANALHFVPAKEQPDFVARLGRQLMRAGRLLVVEYEGRRANPWVPYPISSQRLAETVAKLGYASLTTVATRPSQYGGTLYAAYTTI